MTAINKSLTFSTIVSNNQNSSNPTYFFPSLFRVEAYSVSSFCGVNNIYTINSRNNNFSFQESTSTIYNAIVPSGNYTLSTFTIALGTAMSASGTGTYTVANNETTNVLTITSTITMLLKLQPKKFIINDLNKDLINIWNSVKDDPNDIIDIIEKFGVWFKVLSNNDKLKECKVITSKINTLPYNLERATSYLLMKYCSFFGELVVFNKWVFMGIDRNIYIKNYYPFLSEGNYKNILGVSTYLNGSGYIFNKSYETILMLAQHGDFVFLDPPYIEEKTYKFNY
jgi:hypothetical protein